MIGDFYRALPKRRSLKDVLRFVKRNRRQTVLIIVAIVLSLYLLFDNKGIVRRVQLEMRKAEVQAAIEDAQKQTAQLESQKKALEGDKKTIEKIARERYGMARQGETVYRIKK